MPTEPGTLRAPSVHRFFQLKTAAVTSLCTTPRFASLGSILPTLTPTRARRDLCGETLGQAGRGHRRSFSHEQAQAAAAAKQTLILLTHHNGLQYDGSAALPLWDQVIAELTPLSGGTVIW